MTRQDVMKSIPLKKRFVKDCDLPIGIYENPYFYERLQSLDSVYDSSEKFYEFCYHLSVYNSEQEYFEAYQSIKDSAISRIKNSKAFNTFVEEDFRTESLYPKRNLYIDENDDAAFISIDMKKANFSALHHYSPEIFNSYSTWEDFMWQFTNNEHIISSKYIRQVIFGNCNPKKQIQYERYLMTVLCNWIVKNIPAVNIYSLGDDEIVIQTPREYGVGAGYNISQLRNIVNGCPDGIGLLTRVQVFDLFKVKGTNGWMKINSEVPNGVPEFKCLDPDLIHQVIKHYYGEPISANDLVFTHNGRLASFLAPIINPFE